MATYREIALSDLDDALFSYNHGKYKMSVFCFQQYAKKSAKALLERTNPDSRAMRSHYIEAVLEAYDPGLKGSDLSVKATYLSSFYFNTRYPGDNYAEIVEPQAAKAKQIADELEVYFEAELKRLDKMEEETSIELERSNYL